MMALKFIYRTSRMVQQLTVIFNSNVQVVQLAGLDKNVTYVHYWFALQQWYKICQQPSNAPRVSCLRRHVSWSNQTSGHGRRWSSWLPDVEVVQTVGRDENRVYVQYWSASQRRFKNVICFSIYSLFHLWYIYVCIHRCLCVYLNAVR